MFDEQQWPVNIALVVLGGFLVGGIFAYQPFDPEAAWYTSPWVSLAIVLLLICTSILTFRYIDNKKFKRTMQFFSNCAIIHLGMLVYALESEVFSKGWQGDVAQKQLVKKKPKKRLEYHPSHINNRMWRNPIFSAGGYGDPGSGASRWNTSRKPKPRKKFNNLPWSKLNPQPMPGR